MISVEKLQERVPDIPDGVAADVIAAATAWLGRALSQHLGTPEIYEEYLTGFSHNLLMLEDPPQPEPGVSPELAEVVVTLSVPRGDEEPETLVEGTDFIVRGRRLYRIDNRIWSRYDEHYISYWRGYEVDQGPADWREAVLQMAVLLWQDVTEEGVGLDSESLGDYSWSAAADRTDFAAMLPFVADVVRTSRRIPIAG